MQRPVVTGPRTLRRRMAGLAGLVVIAMLGAGVISGPAVQAQPIPQSSEALTWVAPARPLHLVAGGVNLGSSAEQSFGFLSRAAQDATMQAVRATGATWIRVALPFASDEWSPGRFNWYSDAEVRAALRAGLHVDGLIGWSPVWADRPDASPEIDNLAAFSVAAAEHYSAMGVTTFELWNEPNTNTQWVTGVSPWRYARLLRLVYPAVKKRDPQDNLMIGGLAPVPDVGRQWVSPLHFLARLYADGAGRDFDSLGFHPYSYPQLPAQTTNANAWTWLPQLHAVLADHGDGAKKIWMTEFGAPVSGNAHLVSADAQALGYHQAFAIARGWSWTGPLFAYSWTDWDGDGSGLFGLRAADGTPRPALAAFVRSIAERGVLGASPVVPAVRWSVEGTGTGRRLSWQVVPGAAANGVYEGWSEVTDGGAVSWDATSRAGSGSVTVASLGTGLHSVMLGLYFADGTMREVPSPVVDAGG